MKLISASTTMRALFLALAALVSLPAHAGEVRQISQIIDSAGNPVVNGYIYVGTYNLDPVANPITIYSDVGLTVPIANPQRTDSYGRPVNDIYFAESTYSYTLKDSASVVVEGPKNRYALATVVSSSSQTGSSTWATTVGGTPNAITLTLSPTLVSYTDGMTVRFRVASSNTAATTVSIDGVGARSITKEGGSALVANDLTAGQAVVLVYNLTSTRFELVSADHTLSRTGGTVSGTLSMSAAAINNAIRVDVASVAGTVNLDTAASNSIRITGALAITAFTLADGRFRHVLAGGAFTITTSASLVVTGYSSGTTITFASGDTFDAYGESAGVVRVTNLVLAAGAPRILCAGGNLTTPVDTTEDTLATCTVPANALGANGMIRITAHWNCNNSAGVKTPRIRYSGGGGTEQMGVTMTTVTDKLSTLLIANLGATNIQSRTSHHINSDASITGGISTSYMAVDTTAATTIVFTGQKATAGDTLILKHHTVEWLPSP